MGRGYVWSCISQTLKKLRKELEHFTSEKFWRAWMRIVTSTVSSLRGCYQSSSQVVTLDCSMPTPLLNRKFQVSKLWVQGILYMHAGIKFDNELILWSCALWMYFYARLQHCTLETEPLQWRQCSGGGNVAMVALLPLRWWGHYWVGATVSSGPAEATAPEATRIYMGTTHLGAHHQRNHAQMAQQ